MTRVGIGLAPHLATDLALLASVRLFNERGK